jgi:hypothetical protein
MFGWLKGGRLKKDSDDHLRPGIFAIILVFVSLMRRPAEIVIHKVNRSTELEA